MVQGEFVMKPVGICISQLAQKRHDEKGGVWVDYLNENNIPWSYIDCYDYKIIEKLDEFSAVLWHYSNFDNVDIMEAQNILNIASQKGLKVFPDYNTGWHFDDKIAETYEFQRIGAPIPRSWMFYDLERCENWLMREAEYPLIAKLRRGSGSNNVKLLKTKDDAIRYARHMFSKGYSPGQSLAYKTYSKLQSTKNLRMLIERAKKVPKWLIARKFSQGMPTEKGYCFFQEFIPNDGYDIKVIVVGNKCSFLTRNVRKGGFAASGGGGIAYDKAKVPQSVVISAFSTAKDIGSQCMGFDYVIDKRTNEGKIIEMCYGFDFDAIKACGGYWDQDLIWHNEPLDARREIIKNLLGKSCENWIAG